MNVETDTVVTCDNYCVPWNLFVCFIFVSAADLQWVFTPWVQPPPPSFLMTALSLGAYIFIVNVCMAISTDFVVQPFKFFDVVLMLPAPNGVSIFYQILRPKRFCL